MTKKQFIALANLIKQDKPDFGLNCTRAKELLADFCQAQNPRFNRERWLSYIAGECGPNGGKVK